MRDNVAAWRRLRLRPRVLRHVGAVDVRTNMLSSAVATPLAIAPTAAHGLAHPDAERATARAAADNGTLLVLSTSPTTSLEDVAAVEPAAPRWFQLYVVGAVARARGLVRRAEDSGYTGLMVTVDAPAVGSRHRERLALDTRVRRGSRTATCWGAATNWSR